MPSTDDVVLSTHIRGLEPFIRGKVRDVYDLDARLLIVATDRISAFDSVLPTGIPDKGKVLNQLSAFWFDQIHDICKSHLISTDMGEIRNTLRLSGAHLSDEGERQLAGRSMLVYKAQALPVECVVRGYLEGSGWKEYQRSGSVCGIPLPSGLQQGSKLPEPIFTPSTKATTGHDENITHEQMAGLLAPSYMDQVVQLSLDVYNRASAYALERGIIIADTKFEFGVFEDIVVMIDECLTPDSSRFWDAELYRPGGPQASLDKQFVRDYLDSSGWDHEPPAPALPDEVVEMTREKYLDIYTRLTDRDLA
jgi:phosphoribosylaminoimidazole-succinocarboxamide synthase